MFTFSFLAALLLPFPSPAEDEIPFAELARSVTVEQPACFGREYSAEQLRSRPLQTVRLLRAKLSRQDGSDAAFLEIEAVLKGAKNLHKLWRQFLICADDGVCAVECDGGSVRLAGSADGGLSFHNQRFVLEGGCDGDGEEKETVFLDNKRGGDDLFRLARLPQEYCSPPADSL